MQKSGHEFHLREVARLSGLSTTAAKARLKQLEKHEIITSEKKKNLIIFKTRDTEEYREAKKLYNIQIIKNSGLLKYIGNRFRHPEAVVLFGSVARGEDTEKSDVDIFVLSSVKNEPDFSDFERKIGKKISVIVMTPKEFGEAKKKSPEFVNNTVNGIILEGYLKVL
ncbi:MAG: nucleotidyltransferase domain-containing protein [Candidatus Aenigmarchaeota archaeon]|nr:nucleotidyltransferase domain-containing protein [Candidatus Aenigmarchaeota archaeon]